MASTIRDVAARAGLSVGTVSKYINGKTVKESTRLAIEEAIKELDFHPNNIAKGLRNAKSFSVAILLPMLDSTFCTSMISSIESTLLPFLCSFFSRMTQLFYKINKWFNFWHIILDTML